MKVERQELLQAFNLVGENIAEHPAKPILGCFLLEVLEQNTITIRGTDLRKSIKCDGEIESFCVPKKIIVPIVECLVDDQIEITLENDMAAIKDGDKIIRIPVLDFSDFPPLPLMKVDRQKLLQALNLAGESIATRPTHPIFGCFLFEVLDQNTITICGSNLESTIIRNIPAVCEGEIESFCLHKKIILPIVECLLNDQIEITLENDMAVVKDGDTIIRIPVLDSSGFPSLPTKASDLKSFAFPVEQLNSAINRVASSVSTDETKRILRGINLIGDGQKLELASTNGHCLSIVRIVSELRIQTTILPDTLHKININAIADKKDIVEISYNDQEIISISDNFYFAGKKLEGEYPNYQALIPDNFSTQIEVNRKDLSEVLKLISVMGKDASVSIEWESDKLIICSLSVDVGSVKTIIKCSPILTTGKIAFNLKYLLKAVHFHSSENITINLNDTTSPVIVTGDDDSLFLVMPIHLN